MNADRQHESQQPLSGAHPPGETTGTDERATQRMAAPVLTFNLADETARLHEEHAWQHGERNAKTLVKESDFRIVLIALRAGARMERHQTAGRISIQVLTGRLRLLIAGERVELPQGALVSLERDVPHDVEALEESVFLLTIGWAGVHGTTAG